MKFVQGKILGRLLTFCRATPATPATPNKARAIEEMCYYIYNKVSCSKILDSRPPWVDSSARAEMEMERFVDTGAGRGEQGVSSSEW